LVCGGDQKVSKHVLFVGNSHTFVENLPWLFTDICKQAGLDVHAAMLTYPGVGWRWHLSSYCALPNIRFGGYDYVVLQQKSHPFDGAEALIEQGMELIKAITEANAVAVLMNTWSEKNNPDGQRIIDDAFDALHELCPGSLVAKCGPAWHKLRGSVDLYFEDGEHQNARGAYLNACILAKTIFNVDPLKLPVRIESDALSIRLTTDEIHFLQRTAAEF
jgi:hypothetical protein